MLRNASPLHVLLAGERGTSHDALRRWRSSTFHPSADGIELKILDVTRYFWTLLLDITRYYLHLPTIFTGCILMYYWMIRYITNFTGCITSWTLQKMTYPLHRQISPMPSCKRSSEGSGRIRTLGSSCYPTSPRLKSVCLFDIWYEHRRNKLNIYVHIFNIIE